MKKTIITALLVVATCTAFAQQKLPKQVTLTLTDKQIMRLDSAVQLAVGWTDSKGATDWFIKSFQPVFMQVNKQMAKDTINKKP